MTLLTCRHARRYVPTISSTDVVLSNTVLGRRRAFSQVVHAFAYLRPTELPLPYCRRVLERQLWLLLDDFVGQCRLSIVATSGLIAYTGLRAPNVASKYR